MEALAAVGLAGNVVQFIDFTCKLFEQSVSIYHSRAGTSIGSRSLESVIEDLQNLTTTLAKAALRNSAQTGPSSLHKLAKDCEAVATEMLTTLHGLKARKPGSKWSSMRAALATAWKQSSIDTLERRLDSYRSQLIFHLQFLQDTKSSDFLLLIQELNRKTQRMNVNLTSRISSLKNDVQDAIESLESTLTKQKEAKDAAQQADDEVIAGGDNEATQEASRKAWAEVQKASIFASNTSSLAQILVRSESSGETMIISLTLLESLTFSQMDFRHSKVHDAHPNTFKTVFKQKIIPWLRSPEPLFWISGKPGCGKSTLMKYIVDNPQVRDHLKNPLRGNNPRIASYFFWINGTEMQRSQEGLLQSLLFEILCQSPELIQVALPDGWQSTRAMARQFSQSSKTTWKRADLLAATERLSRSKIVANQLCVFVDGLDEYEGEPDDLIETIRHLKKLGMKMCIASRPWNVFEESFGLNPQSKIYLQDLNRPDIELYVNDKLRKRPELERMRKTTAGTEILIDQLIDEIVEKSRGVFLWVFLVVKSLIEGLRNHDRLSQLQKRLRQFPSDLQQFFNHIFESMEPVYHSQTAQMFQVALQVERPPSPLLYWFLDELEDSPHLALSMKTGDLDETDFTERIESSKRRINGRCKGLLECTGLLESTVLVADDEPQEVYVDFLHRTVKDFLMTTEIRHTFVSWQLEDFDADLAICKSALAEFKSGVDSWPWMAKGALSNFFYAAKQIEVKYGETPTSYLHELERTGELYPRIDSDYPWELLGATCFLEAIIAADLLLFAQTRSLEFPRLFGIPKSHSKNLFQIKKVSFEMMQLALSATSSSLGGLVPLEGASLNNDCVCFFNYRFDVGNDHEMLEWLQMIVEYATFDMNFVSADMLDKLEQIIASNTGRKVLYRRKSAKVEIDQHQIAPASKPIDGMGIAKQMLDMGPGTMVTARPSPRQDVTPSRMRERLTPTHHATPSRSREQLTPTHHATPSRSSERFDTTSRQSQEQMYAPRNPDPYQPDAPSHHANWPQSNTATQPIPPQPSGVYPLSPLAQRGFFKSLREKLSQRGKHP